MFCATLEYIPGTWGPCDEYLEAGSTTRAEPGDLHTEYRVLVIPGIFEECINPLATAFGDASMHLDEAHHNRTLLSISSSWRACFPINLARQRVTVLATDLRQCHDAEEPSGCDPHAAMITGRLPSARWVYNRPLPDLGSRVLTSAVIVWPMSPSDSPVKTSAKGDP